MNEQVMRRLSDGSSGTKRPLQGEASSSGGIGATFVGAEMINSASIAKNDFISFPSSRGPLETTNEEATYSHDGKSSMSSVNATDGAAGLIPPANSPAVFHLLGIEAPGMISSLPEVWEGKAAKENQDEIGNAFYIYVHMYICSMMYTDVFSFRISRERSFASYE